MDRLRPTPIEIVAELDPEVFKTLITEPPQNPDLAALWHSTPPDRSFSDNPFENIARRLFPSSTEESVRRRWDEIGALADKKAAHFRASLNNF